jgi:DNA-binding response OmpR family regulator
MMTHILLVADAAWVHNEVRAALTQPGLTIVDETDPTRAAERVADLHADAVLIDMQVGSMGGMAVCRSIKEAASTGGIVAPPVVMLLDRRADAFLARRAAADAWVLKPFTPHQLRDALEQAVRGAVQEPA